MAKNITISEDGVSKNFNGVKRLRTSLQGGGACNWIPQDELSTKTIYDRGTYNASSDGVYGYTSVTVDMADADSRYY